MGQIEIEELYNEYVPLINWAGRKYAEGKTPVDEEEFKLSGKEIFAICIKKWEGRNFDKIEFGKYFKTALFRKLLQMRIGCSRKKRSAIVFSLETDLGAHGGNIENKGGKLHKQLMSSLKLTDGGFEDFEYRDLVEYVASFLKGLELKIFRLLIACNNGDAPNELLAEVAFDTFRKQKAALCNGKRRRNYVIKISKTHIVTFLNNNGESITEKQYSKALEKLKKKVVRHLARA